MRMYAHTYKYMNARIEYQFCTCNLRSEAFIMNYVCTYTYESVHTSRMYAYTYKHMQGTLRVFDHELCMHTHIRERTYNTYVCIYIQAHASINRYIYIYIYIYIHLCVRTLRGFNNELNACSTNKGPIALMRNTSSISFCSYVCMC